MSLRELPRWEWDTNTGNALESNDGGLNVRYRGLYNMVLRVNTRGDLMVGIQHTESHELQIL